jgi:hypothetical protein
MDHTDRMLAAGELSFRAATQGLVQVSRTIGKRWPDRAEWTQERVRRWIRLRSLGRCAP